LVNNGGHRLQLIQQWWLPTFDIPERLLHLSMDNAFH
jgi:hypothetical protein